MLSLRTGMSGARKARRAGGAAAVGGAKPPSPPQAGALRAVSRIFLRVWEGAERGWQGLAWVRAFGVSLKPGERFARTGPEKREKRAVDK